MEVTEELAGMIDRLCAPAAVVCFDGRFAAVNVAFADLVGVDGGDLVGEGFATITYHDDVAPGMAVLHALAAGQEVTGRMTKRYVRADGALVWVETSLSVLRDGAGCPSAIFVQVRPVDRPSAEEVSLRDSEQRFRAAFDNAPIGIAVVGIGGELLRTNRALRAILGRTAEDLVGAPFAEVLHPEDLDSAENARRDLLRGRINMLRVERRLLRGDGSILWSQLTATLVRDGAGEAMHFLVHVVDLTHRSITATGAPERAFLQELAGASDDLLFFRLRLQPSMGFTYISESVATFCGYSANELYADPHIIFDLVHPDDSAVLLGTLADPVGSAGELLLRWRHQDGSELVTKAHTAPVHEDDQLIGIEGVLVDITGQRQAEDALRANALTDGLTQLPNRVLIQDRIEQALIRARHSASTAAVLTVDIDRFSSINSSLGFRAGDEVLVEVAGRLGRATPGTHTVGRFAGDEYVVCAESFPDVDAVRQYADQLRQEVCGVATIGGTVVDLRVTVGVAVAGTDHASAVELLRRSGEAVRQARSNGEGIAVFDAGAGHLVQTRHRRVLELAGAAERGEMETYYQPIIDLETGEIVAAEALLRWNHPAEGLVPPDQFIPAAEQSGAITALGAWIVDDACARLADWRATEAPALTVSVNLSARQLADRAVIEMLTTALAVHGLPPSAVTVEVTESTALGSGHLCVLREIDALGIPVALDDFGTHYSSLAYLQWLPLQQLKIDRSFVTGLEHDRSQRAIIMATAQLARGLRLRTVAEGVETEREASELHLFGIDRAQGYHFGRPMPAEDFRRHLRGHRAATR